MSGATGLLSASAAALVAGVVAFAAFPSSKAHACSCVMPVLSDQVANSDVVLSGVVLEPAPPAKRWGAEPVVFRFQVERLLKGAVPGSEPGTADEVAEIRTAGNSAACGSNFIAGKEYVVFAGLYQGVLTTGLCSGNQLSTPELIADVEKELRVTPTDPPPNDPPPSDPPPSDPPPTNNPPPVAKGNPACGGCSLGSDHTGLGSSLLLLAVLFAGLRRNTRKR